MSTATRYDTPLTLQEVEVAAKKNLPKHIYEFYASGSDDGEALRRNVDGFSRYVNTCAQHMRVRVVDQG